MSEKYFGDGDNLTNVSSSLRRCLTEKQTCEIRNLTSSQNAYDTILICSDKQTFNVHHEIMSQCSDYFK